jgi:hypothetical protein
MYCLYRRGYRNPEFFAKMVEHMEIQQYGTAFDPEVRAVQCRHLSCPSSTPSCP